MKRIAFVISLLSVSCTTALAQQSYFVFIQSEKQQPFYVRLHEKTYSSSAIGHLVLSQLGDSTYHLVIGFPKNQFPERDFVIPIASKDHAYQLKWVDERGWVLFNEQSSEIQKPLQDASGGNSLQLGERKTGEFAALMSSLVNDSSVMYKTLVKVDPPKPAAPAEVKADSAIAIKEEKKKEDSVRAEALAAIDPVQPPVVVLEPKIDTARVDSVKTDTLKTVMLVPTPDSTVAIKVDSTAHKQAPDTLTVAKATEPAPNRTVISKVEERVGEHGKEWVYVDSSAAGVDTIPVLIALEAAPVKPEKTKAEMDSAIAAAVTADSAKMARQVDSAVAINERAPLTANNGVADIKQEVDSTKTVSVHNFTVEIDSTATTSPKALVLFNSDCVNFANEQDVDKLRIKMLAVNSTDDKIGVAKKVFKTKCFVTRYIKGLSELFPNDEARFKFFETAYPFVSDTSSFKGLISLLSDELYIARFKALVRM
jgi:hypothetical protein